MYAPKEEEKVPSNHEVESLDSSDEANSDASRENSEFSARVQKEYTLVESEANHSIIGFYNNAKTGWNGFDSTNLMHSEGNSI